MIQVPQPKRKLLVQTSLVQDNIQKELDISIDSTTEKYNFNDSDSEISDFSDMPENVEHTKNQVPDIELFDETETDKRRFFEAFEDKADFGQLLHEMSDSESEINTSELLRDVLPKDDYSLSFESVTDLKDLKYDSKYELETDLMTGISLSESVQDYKTIEKIDPLTLKEEEGVHDNYEMNDREDNEKGVREKDLIKVDENVASMALSEEKVIDLSTEKAKSLPTARDDEPIDQEIPKQDPIFESKPFVTTSPFIETEIKTEKKPESTPKPLDSTSFLTFADLLRMNEDSETPKSDVVVAPKKTGISNSPTKKASVKNQSPERKKATTGASPAKPSPRLDAPVHKSPQRQANAALKNVEKESTSPYQAKSKNSLNKKELLHRASNKFAALNTTQVTEKDVRSSTSPVRTTLPAMDSEQANSAKKIKELEDQLAVYQQDATKLMNDIKELEKTLLKTVNEKDSMDSKLIQRDNDIVTLQKQIEFLETALTNEKSAKKSSGPLLSLEESESIKKEIADQEYLIRGYQTENEKLVAQVKELKSIVAETEQRSLMKLEQFKKENQMLKNQLELVESQALKSDYGSTIHQVKFEQLSQKINDMEHEQRIQHEDSMMMQKKYEALLQDKDKQLDVLQDANPEQLKQLKLEHQKKIDEYNAYILELETKLEWYIENQDIANDIQNRIGRYEEAIAELSSLQEKKVLKNRSSGDIKRIKQLENQVKDLQDDQRLLSKPMPDVERIVKNKRPSITLEESLKHLKIRIHSLEGENAKLKADFSKHLKELDLELLNTKSNNERLQQEVPMGLEKQTKRLQSERDELKVANKELESQLAKLKEEPSRSNPDQEEALRKLQLHDTNQKNRIRELEQQLQQQTLKFSQWEKEKSKMIHDLQAEMLELQNAKQDLEMQLESQNSLQQLAVRSDLKLQLQNTQAALEAAISKSSTLEMRLELQENARKTIQETTLDLLKETQRESSKMAFTHTQKSLDLLRQEWKKEQDFVLEQRTKEFKMQIHRLQQQLEKEGIDELKKQKYQLEHQYQELEKDHQDCLERIERLKSGSAPSAVEFDRLAAKIKQLESKSSQSELAKELMVLQKERDELKRAIKSKDTKIKEFEREISELIGGIIQVKREIGFL